MQLWMSVPTSAPSLATKIREFVYAANVTGTVGGNRAFEITVVGL